MTTLLELESLLKECGLTDDQVAHASILIQEFGEERWWAGHEEGTAEPVEMIRPASWLDFFKPIYKF